MDKITTPGKHHFTITVHGDTREYYVHIPTRYDGKTSMPVVFMLHGSSGNGLRLYNISGWVQQGEAENIITVFPSSWKYDCVIDEGVEKHNTEKWNDYGLETRNNVNKRDDVKFLKKVIEDVSSKFNVNNDRIYFVGFSNGGGMVSRCAIEMSDELAAVVACAGILPPDSFYYPLKNYQYSCK